MAIHRVEPTTETVHGRFSRDLPPILTIDPGDTVVYRTLDAGWGLEAPHSDGSPRRKLERPDPEHHGGHALCGPVAIRGAKPGMTLEIQIQAIIPGSFGFGSAGWGWMEGLHERLNIPNEERFHRWTLDTNSMTGMNQYGHQVALRPFMGVMGVAPAEAGFHPTAPPCVTGGNMDCKDLAAGSTLYLPVQMDGALFSVGDGHGVQGHGEVSGLAIECPMDKVELTFNVCEDMPLNTPCARTPTAWISLGFHQDLDEAFFPALNGILDIMMPLYGLERADALALASLIVDIHVTQLVNGVRGIHAVLPHNALQIAPTL